MGTAARVGGTALVIVVVMLPVWVPLGMTVAFRGLSDRVLAWTNRFVTRCRRIITAAFLDGFGAYLAVKGAHWG